MITRNVYLIYPAGYSGTYLKWAIEISDLDSRSQTPWDPINNQKDKQFGGTGTAHQFTRIPTHQGYSQHVNWMIYNRPTKSNVYLINPGDGRNSETNAFGHYQFIAGLLLQDSTGIVINIHDNNDQEISSYGRINCVTKWPTYIPAISSRRAYNRQSYPAHSTFDPFNCENDMVFRNFVVEHDILGSNGPLDLEQLQDAVSAYEDWYRVRNQYQPHEVNTDTYPSGADLGRVYELCCTDMIKEDFPTVLEKILCQSSISDRYDCDHVRSFHNNYITAQTNLQWFDSIKIYKETGDIAQYLLSHSVIQAEVIRHIFHETGISELGKRNNLPWQHFYYRAKDTSWPDCDQEKDFYRLPTRIQNELIDKFGYAVKVPWHMADLVHVDWKSMSLQEISSVYQNCKRATSPVS